MSSRNPYKITSGRDQHLKPAGPGTRIMASIFSAAVGAGLGAFFFIAVIGNSRSTRSIAGATASSNPTGVEVFSALFWGFLAAGAVIGALVPVIMWPSRRESGDDE